MRILVTGAAGFIGSHLTEHLLAEGHEVAGLDNFYPFYDPDIKRHNLEAAHASGRFQLLEGDLRDERFLARSFDACQPDVLIHLAAMAGVRPSIQDPGLYFDVNVRGTLNLLEQCRQGGVRRILFASSSSVYGANPDVPFRETDRVDNPISPYAASKKAGELLCHTYHHLHQLSIACLRFFTVYGPRQRPDLAIHKFARLIDAGKPIPFFGDGTTRRDYTYIDDTVAGVLGALRWVSAPGSARYDLFNLGESRTVALSELVELLEAALGKKAILQRLPDQPGDVPITYADIRRARAQLGYDPQVPIEEGIQRFIAWFRTQPR
jgi:UDP-glucuronate 4-epimerase